MMMTIALRFIPTLIDETQKIMAAQKARGADMEAAALYSVQKHLPQSSFRFLFQLLDVRKNLHLQWSAAVIRAVTAEHVYVSSILQARISSLSEFQSCSSIS